MLGELIAELKGKSVGRRVVDVEGPSMEISVSLNGNMRGTQVTESATYVNRPTSSSIVFYGKGQGIVMAGESEVVTFTGEGFGRVGSIRRHKVARSIFLSNN